MRIKVKNFDLKSVITSGACFRFIEEQDGSFTNILKDRVINIKQNNDELIVISSKENNLENIIKEYFDLNRDYIIINQQLINNDKKMINIIPKCKGYKILNQDPFEMCISYIISQNNNVKRISKSINDISEKYGKKVIFNNKEYHLFPTYKSLKNISIEELRNFKVGFRAEYIRDFLDKYETLKDINKLNTKEALNELMKVKGIGLKVSSCILLFGYKRLDTFPIDTWVKKSISDLYNIKNDQKTIEKFAEQTYKEYSGLAIQYLFHSKRNIN